MIRLVRRGLDIMSQAGTIDGMVVATRRRAFILR